MSISFVLLADLVPTLPALSNGDNNSYNIALTLLMEWFTYLIENLYTGTWLPETYLSTTV